MALKIISGVDLSDSPKTWLILVLADDNKE